MSEATSDIAEVIPSRNVPPSLKATPDSDEPIDYFSKGIHTPLDSRVTIGPDEQRKMAQCGRATVSSHIVTTVLLRCAGNNTTVFEYDKHQKTLDELRQAEKAEKEQAAIELASQAVASTLVAAEPYMQVFGRVTPYTAAYRDTYPGLTSEDKAAIRREIYGIDEAGEPLDEVVAIVHPGIDDIQAMRPVLGDKCVESERILRFILQNELDQSPESRE